MAGISRVRTRGSDVSVGGIVVETIVLPDRVWVSTQEPAYPYDEPVAIYVERTPESRSISEGDSLWWQGPWAMWTPKSHSFEDRKLRRIGGSGIKRPPSLGSSPGGQT